MKSYIKVSARSVLKIKKTGQTCNDGGGVGGVVPGGVLGIALREDQLQVPVELLLSGGQKGGVIFPDRLISAHLFSIEKEHIIYRCVDGLRQAAFR